METPGERLLPQPDTERRLNTGNLALGCLNGVAVVICAWLAFFAFIADEPTGGVFGTLVTFGFLVLAFRQHFVLKKRSYLLGALLFIGFALLAFGLCVAILSNTNFN